MFSHLYVLFTDDGAPLWYTAFQSHFVESAVADAVTPIAPMLTAATTAAIIFFKPFIEMSSF